MMHKIYQSNKTKILIRKIITSNKNKFRDKFRTISPSYRITQCVVLKGWFVPPGVINSVQTVSLTLNPPGLDYSNNLQIECNSKHENSRTTTSRIFLANTKIEWEDFFKKLKKTKRKSLIFLTKKEEWEYKRVVIFLL